jgi:microsomal dipeptidase-like Zn-dependent dipeptidase
MPSLISPAKAVSIDLHNHLFMKDGVGPLHTGRFEEPTGAASPYSRLRTKMTSATLDASGLKLIVVSFYAHPILTLGAERERLLSQIAQAESFVKENPEWVIASEPAEARAALAAGKRVFVFSLETAAGFVETAADQDLFINGKKIRIITFMHLTPDSLGRGVALYPGPGFVNSPIEYFRALIAGNKDPETGTHVNPYGLSEHGKTVLRELVKRRVWIDLAHASDKAMREMVEVLDEVGQPSLFTHTKLRDIAHNERAVPKFALARVKVTGGMVGLIPTDELSRKLSPETGLPAECRTGMRAFAEEWRRTVELSGSPEAVTLGSDFNAPLPGLKGGCAEIAEKSDQELSKSGFFRGEELPKLTSAMRSIGVDPEPSADRTLERFLTAWEKVRNPLGAAVQTPETKPASEKTKKLPSKSPRSK